MKKVKKQTKNQKEYKKQVKRLQQIVRRLMSRGYRFNDSDEIPDIKTIIGEKPKRITEKYLNKLKNIKPKNLAQQADYYDNEGINWTGEQGLEIEKKQRKAKAKERAKEKKIKQEQKQADNAQQTSEEQQADNAQQTSEEQEDFVYSNEELSIDIVTNFLSEYVYLGIDVYQLLYDWILLLINEHGFSAVSDMLESGANHGILVQSIQPYHLDDGITYISDMLNYLDVPESTKQDVMDSMNAHAEELYSIANAEGRTVFW